MPFPDIVEITARLTFSPPVCTHRVVAHPAAAGAPLGHAEVHPQPGAEAAGPLHAAPGLGPVPPVHHAVEWLHQSEVSIVAG